MLAVGTGAPTGVLTACRSACTSRTSPSQWAHVTQAPPDAILGVAAAFNAEKRKDKVNLSVGAYRDENGKPYVLKCIRKAEASLLKKHPGHEYLPVCWKWHCCTVVDDCGAKANNKDQQTDWWA